MSVEALQSDLVLLRSICEKEQQALVKLDGPALSRLVRQKTHVLREIQHLSTEHAKTGEPLSDEVAALAGMCRRLNATNRRMLIVALRCIDELQRLFVDSSGPGYGKARRPRPARRLDSRV